MTKETQIRVHRIYSILLSIVIVIAGICLIAGCLNIYNSGDHPFSREIVAETFSGIAFPVLLCLGMTILSFILDTVLPSNKEKTPMIKPYPTILSRMYANKDMNQCDETVKEQVTALQKNRKLHSTIRIAVLIIASIVFLIYALNGNNFHQSDINGSMIKAMWILIPCLFVSFGYALFVTIHNEKSMEKEIELLKSVPSANAKKEETQSETSEKKLNIFRLSFLFVAVFCLVYGFITGGTADVLTKAINICTECIGLG